MIKKIIMTFLYDEVDEKDIIPSLEEWYDNHNIGLYNLNINIATPSFKENLSVEEFLSEK